MSRLDDVVPSPNIWHHPRVYEAENQGLDPAGVIDAALREVHDWANGRVVDVGCGSGFHLPRLAAEPGAAATVTGVEPYQPLRASARRRLRGRGLDGPRVRVLAGTTAALPLATSSVDVVHARWAYFFGPGCEPGLAELARVLGRGGTAAVVDTDASRSTFGRWFTRAHPGWDPAAVERFWACQGWSRRALDVTLELPDRQTFEQVLRIELGAEVASRALAEHPGTRVDHAVVLRWRHY